MMFVYTYKVVVVKVRSALGSTRGVLKGWMWKVDIMLVV